MLRKYSLAIAALVVCFFTWTSSGVFSVAHAAPDAVKKGTTEEYQQGKGEGAEERLSRLTEELAGMLADPKADADSKKGRLVAGKSEIEAIDAEVRRQFAETEHRLRAANLPTEILERHHRFVKHYDDNLAELKGNVERVEKAKDLKEVEVELEKIRKHLERVKSPSRRQKDAKSLPERQPEMPKREPRLKKEDFEQDLKKDKHAWRDRRIMVASTGSLAGLIVPDDLAETLEVQLTPEIRAKALELGNNPVKIYEWVRNNVEYVPTWGSIQGAPLTLLTQKGNAFDTSSLLIALLRASGIHARYAVGTIEVPIQKAMSWTGGLSDPAATVELLASAGIPVRPVYSGATIQKLQLEHVWVEAWIDYLPSRGARHREGQGDTWIPLDASYKEHRTSAGIDLATAAPFDKQDFIGKLTASSTIDEPQSYATNVKCTSVSQFQGAFRTAVQDFLVSEHPGATLSDVLGSTELVAQQFPYLLGTLPYRTIVKGGEFSEIPPSFRHSVTFNLVNNDTQSAEYSETTLSLSIALPKLAGKRVTLSYSPATAADEAVIAAYAPRPHADGTPISLGEYPSSLPAYLIQVKAELRVNGVVVASGVGPNLGGYEQLNIRMQNPNLPSGTQEFMIKAGEYVGIAFGTGPVSVQHLEQAKSAIEETASKLKSGNLSGLTKDEVLGSFLHASALASLAEMDTINDVRARVMGVTEVRRPSSSVVTLMLSTTYFFGIPRGITVAGTSNAEMGYRMAVTPKDGNRDKTRQYLIMSGLDASAAPAVLQQYLLSTPEYPVTSVSTVKAILAASERAIPVYRIVPSNSAAINSKLLLSEDVERTMADDAGAGLTLIAPQQNVSIGLWSGVGYEAVDSASANNYASLIGPPRMVQGMPWIGRSVLLGLLPGNAEPPAVLSSSIVSDAFIEGLGGVSTGVGGLSARPASESLDLLTSSLVYDRLGDQLGCYVDLKSPPVSTGACMATYLSLLCNAAGTPIVADTNHRPVADAGTDLAMGIGDTVTLDASRSLDPDNDTLVYRWRFASIPQGSSATLTDAAAVAPSFTADTAGVYAAELTVTDGKKTSLADTVTVTAYPAVVTIPSVTGLNLEEGETKLRGAGLSVGSISAAIDSAVEAGKIATQNPAAGTGADRGSAVNLIVSTGAQPDTEAPAVKITFDRSPALYPAGTPVLITAEASDLVGISSVAISVDGTPVAVTLPVTKVDTTGFAPGSNHTVKVTAQDISLNAATATATFAILDPADKAAPVISTPSPAAEAAITAPTDIVGTVSDSNLLEYTLSYAPAGKGPYTVFARGTNTVVNGVLGRLDPTLMQNGIYDVVLSAMDVNGNTTSYSTRYRITGDLKVGNFTVSFTDLNIPLAGIPVTVTRTYDSRDKSSGDFGFGWSIDIQNVKTEENRIPGEGWSQISSGGDFPTYCVEGEGERYVAVTLPDGKVEEFDLIVTPRCRALVPIQYPTLSYTARPGTTSTLQAKNVGQVYNSPSGVLLDLDTLEPYNPSQYTLTTTDGTAYELDQTFGIKSVKDTNGNSLTYGTSGITHSSGKSVAFRRDLNGRITHITEPSGKAITFSYDASGNLASVTDPGGNVTRYTYNASHGLIDIIDPLGRRAVRNEYDGSGRLTAHIDAEGKRIEYTHDIAGRQEVVKDRNGNVTVFIYDEKGRVLKKTDPLGKSVTYTYDSVGNKLSETDPVGNTTTWTYDGKKNVLSETRVSNGQSFTTRHTYNDLGKLLTTTDPKGNVTASSYDGKGNLLTTTDALGKVTTNTYDSKGSVLTTTDPLGNITRYEYDSYGNQTRQTAPNGAVTSYSYDSRGNKIAETDPKGNTTTYGYDGNGKLLKVTDALGNVTAYEYDKAGNKVAETNPLGLTTRYTYDSANRLVATAYPDGTTTSTTFDAEGNRATSTDRLGRMTGYSYNANKQLVKTTYPDGTSQILDYDAAGRQLSSTDAAGKTSTKEYDALGRVIRTTDPDNHSVTFAYDANGNQVQQTDSNGHVTRYEYDAANRQIKTTLSGGQATTIAYDELGRKAVETDAAGVTTQFAYDESGNLAGVTDAMGHITRYEYDENNNRTAIVDANGHRTEFAFDQLNRLITKTMPNGGVERYAYDAAGRQASKTDAKGQKITFSYDAANRMTIRTYPDGSTVGFTYTATGKRATAKDNRGTTSYTYNDRDRLTGTTNPDGKSIGYSYDLTGRLATLTGPAGIIRYAYSGSGRLTSVTDPEGRATTYSYDNAGNRTGLSYPNGTDATYSYDVNNRLTQLTHNSASSVIASYVYTLGAIGNRTRIDEGTGISRVYTYDSLYRLTKEQVADPAGSQTYTTDYTYDSVGNRLNKAHTPAADQPAVSTDYSYNAADQLITENGVTYSYDLNGNLASKTDSTGSTTYGYNYDDRLVKVTTPTQALTYAYDADGNRIESTGPEGTTRYLVDNNRSLSQILAEYQPNETITASYVYVDDLISMTRGGQTDWYHYDGLGSTRLLSDETGAVTDTYEYDAFGNLVFRTGSTDNSFLFTGQKFDANTGLYHLRARYYQPGVGRFTSFDPWAGDPYAPVSLHRYLYTANDPVNKIDPTGNFFTINEVLTVSQVAGVLMNSYSATTAIMQGRYTEAAVNVGFLALDFTGVGMIQRAFNRLGAVIEARVLNQSIDAFREWGRRNQLVRLFYKSSFAQAKEAIDQMIKRGAGIDEIAREAHRLRQAAQQEARLLMDVEELAELEAENLRRFGNKVGPSFDQLLSYYKGNYTRLVESSFRSNPAVNALFLIWY